MPSLTPEVSPSAPEAVDADAAAPTAAAPSRKLRALRWAVRALSTVVILLGGMLVFLTAHAWTAVGTSAEGERLARMGASKRYHDGRFHNDLPRVEPPLGTMLKRWFFEESEAIREPTSPLPVLSRTSADFAKLPSNGLRITWLGHSSMLIEIDGATVLTDPVWGERTSPFTFYGPKRFFEPPVKLDELPKVDLVLISHDHYDHLDHPTVVELNRREVRFVVPLGVGAHLEYWGVPKERIVELDWWQETEVKGLRVVATPSRHFSGRSIGDRDATLWASYAMVGPQHRAYFSGDTAMFPGFEEIGQRLGPFDVTMIEVGAYNAMWADVHLGPEQAVLAHQSLQGGLMIPIHWGTFNLAFHAWTEPAERLIVAAEQRHVALAIPKPGESVEAPHLHIEDARLAAHASHQDGDVVPLAVSSHLDLSGFHAATIERWWPSIPWETAEQHPVISSGLTTTPRQAWLRFDSAP